MREIFGKLDWEVGLEVKVGDRGSSTTKLCDREKL